MVGITVLPFHNLKILFSRDIPQNNSEDFQCPCSVSSVGSPNNNGVDPYSLYILPFGNSFMFLSLWNPYPASFHPDVPGICGSSRKFLSCPSGGGFDRSSLSPFQFTQFSFLPVLPIIPQFSFFTCLVISLLHEFFPPIWIFDMVEQPEHTMAVTG